MSTLFVDSVETQQAPGAYVVEVAPPRIIEGLVSGYIGFVFQGEWGPDNVLTEPGSTPEFMALYFPAGTPHTSSGYRALMRRKRMPLRPVRILNGGAQATVTAPAGAGTYTATAKYKGTVGNSITLLWQAATDGDAAHRDLLVTLTDATTGTTVERVRNVVAGTDLAMTGSVLLSSVTFTGATALPAAGTSVTLSGGSNGAAVTSTQYRNALALLAVRSDVFVVVTDDPGDAIRAAVNDEVVAHVNSKRDRIGVIQTTAQNETWANVKAYVNAHSPSVRSDRVIPCGAWVETLDDSGASVTTPFSTFVASALANLEPQQSHARWEETATQFYEGVAGIVAPFDTNDDNLRGEATTQGILLPVRLDTGAYAALHDRTSSLTSGKRFVTTRRIKDFLARSIRTNIQGFVNGINWRGRQTQIKGLVDAFLTRQGPTVRRDEPRVIAHSTDINSVNTPAGVALGNFNLALDAQTPSVMEKIGLLFNVGETVTVRETV